MENTNSNHTKISKGKILIIAANPSVSKTTGWPIGFWAAELTHPYWEFSKSGFEVEIASPDGGKIEFDSFSDPEHESGYSAADLISLGWKHSKKHMDLLSDTIKLSEANPDDFDAVFLVGGQSPMFTFKDNKMLSDFVVNFYLTGKPTALVCHSTCLLLDAKLPDGKHLVENKKWTGFANSEEKYADDFTGIKIQPFWIEDEAKKIQSEFIVKSAFTPFAIEDGNLITGQQQYSGTEAAKLVISQINKNKSK